MMLLPGAGQHCQLLQLCLTHSRWRWRWRRLPVAAVHVPNPVPIACQFSAQMLLVTQMMMMMRRGVAVPRANVNAAAILCLLQLLQALLVASRTCWSVGCGLGVAGDDREKEQQQQGQHQRKDAAVRGQSHCA